MDKRQVVAFLAKRVANPVMKRLAGYIPGWSLLETTGRKTGRPHRNPVGNGLAGDTFWIVAEHGYRADYVRNIQAHPQVRIRVGGRWRRGVAHLLPKDDARARQRRLGGFNAGLVRLMATDLLTIRVDLEPR